MPKTILYGVYDNQGDLVAIAESFEDSLIILNSLDFSFTIKPLFTKKLIYV